MQQIKIISPVPPTDHEGPFSARDTEVFLGEYKVQYLQDIRAYWPINGPAKVELEVLANKDLNFEANGVDLHITIMTYPGYVIVEKIDPVTGHKHYSCERAA